MIPGVALRLTIGDFSRMTLLSVKALRHYHEIGLLEPVAVDPASGYRLYDMEQVPVAQVIRRLKDLGMGLDDVKRVLDAPDLSTRNSAIVEHLQRLESQLELTKANVASLRRLLEGPDGLEQRVEFRSQPPTPSIAIRERVATDELDGWWVDAFEELHDQVRRGKLTRSGPDGALYGGQWFEEGAGEVIAFTPIARPTELRLTGRAEPYPVPPAELAVLLHSGPLRDIDRTFAALGEFVSQRAIGMDGPMREYYLVTAFDTADEMSHRTEVAWPVFQVVPGS